MPYKQGRQWRATPSYKGQRLPQKLCDTKREAGDWEREQRDIARKAEKTSHVELDLLTFCSKYMLYAERFRPKTIAEKKAMCERILKAWGPERDVQTITVEDMQKHIDLQAVNKSHDAANRERKNLMALWTFGNEKLDLQANPVKKTDPWTYERSIPEVYTEEEILALLVAAGREEKLILKTFLESAGRKNEIWSLTVQDVNLEQKALKLWTRKTSDGNLSGEWLPISDDLVKEFQWWFKNRPLKDSPWLFPNPVTGNPYIDQRKWLKRICRRAGVPYKGFHAFRRYVGSILVDKYKVSTKTVQNLYRHKRLTTTEKYIFAVHSALRDTVGLAVPEEKLPQDITPKKKGVNDKNR